MPMSARFACCTLLAAFSGTATAADDDGGETRVYGHGGSGSDRQITATHETYGTGALQTHRQGLYTSLVLVRDASLTVTNTLQGSGQRAARDDENLLPRRIGYLSEMVELRSSRAWMMASLSTRSDKLFSSLNDLEYGGFALYDLLKSEEHSVFVGGFFVSSFAIEGVPSTPLPLVVYQYRSDRFSITGPLPFMFQWQISGALSCSYNFDFSKQHAYLRYLAGPFTVGAEAAYVQEANFLEDREDPEQIRWYENGKLGVRGEYSPNALSVVAFAGTTFQGRLYDAESTMFTEKSNVQTLDNAFFVDVAVGLSW